MDTSEPFVDPEMPESVGELVLFAALEADGNANDESVVVKMKNSNGRFPMKILVVSWIDMEMRQEVEMFKDDIKSISPIIWPGK